MPNEAHLKITTPRGAVRGVYHPVESASSAVVMVSGAFGGVDGPSGAYPALARQFQAAGIAALRLDYRVPTNMNECVYDLDSGLEELRRRGVERFALVG